MERNGKNIDYDKIDELKNIKDACPHNSENPATPAREAAHPVNNMVPRPLSTIPGNT